MRYIIIPLVVILYCIWTYRAYKDYFKTLKPDFYNTPISFFWFYSHIIILVVTISLIIGYFAVI